MKVKVPDIKLPWSYIKAGDILTVEKHDDGYFDTECGIFGRFKNYSHLDGADWIVTEFTPNRDFLSDFLKLNNIKKTLVSKYLGYSQNWLTQMANDKRRDMKDATLQSIMKKLHIDWTQDTFIYVKATKEHTAYRTRPCTYKHDKHKEMLQRAMWDGLFVKA